MSQCERDLKRNKLDEDNINIRHFSFLAQLVLRFSLILISLSIIGIVFIDISNPSFMIYIMVIAPNICLVIGSILIGRYINSKD